MADNLIYSEIRIWQLPATKMESYIMRFRINLKRNVHPRSLKADIKRIFDKNWYIHRYPDIFVSSRADEKDAFQHFLEYGLAEGRSPNALFDFKYLHEVVRNERGINFENNIDLLRYFLKDKINKALSTHALFDPAWYLLKNEDVRNMCESGKTYPLRHIIEHGAIENRSPNPMFDPAWYLNQYQDAAILVEKRFITTIIHYILIGSLRGYSPGPAFDTKWYLEQNADVKEAVLRGETDALSHYLRHGKQEGRKILPSRDTRSSKNANQRERYIDGAEDKNNVLFENTKLSEFPVVSIIIVNHNGISYLCDLINSLNEQTYRNFEIVFVDNNSNDASIAFMQDMAPRARIIKLEKNLGFAEANNIGQYNSSGEIIALLNNDTRVDREWLNSAVNMLKQNPNAGAIASKIRFWQKFCTIDIWSKEKFQLSKLDLLASLSYNKLFTNYGRDDGESLSSMDVSQGHWLSIKVPVQKEPIHICITTVAPEQPVKIESGFHTVVEHANNYMVSLSYDLQQGSIETSRYVINNAGTCEREDLTPYDRGYGEYDDGQYEVSEPIPMFCGCSAIIRRDALVGETLFLSDFYAYYEDSELSKRITSKGLEILYAPTSIVFHRHSATSVERSAFWHRQVRQNGIIYKYIQTSQEERRKFLNDQLNELNHESHFLCEKGDARSKEENIYYSVLPDVIRGVQAIAERIENGLSTTRIALRTGIYNDHWRTLGGGEAHALNFLRYLSSKTAIELISTRDFDLKRTLEYYGVPYYNVRKRLVRSMTPQVTKEYDIFINGSYMNECISLAQRSYYILHFPSRTPSEEFLRSYKFLPNSRYTCSWAERLWGKERFDASLVYPSVARGIVKFDPAGANPSKEKIILSVGRFFSSGHSKNQHVIAEIFRKLVDVGALVGWKLWLIGSSNDEEYRASISKSLQGYDASVVTNARLDFLASMYERSSVYIHASGFGKSVQEEPENFEHFGMTVVEAAMNGCFPVVYNEAGPLEIVQTLGMGYSYGTIEDGMIKLESICREMNSEQERTRICSEVCRISRRLFTINDDMAAISQLGSIFGLE